MKKKCDEVPVELLEEMKKKSLKDQETFQKQLDEADINRERAERAKKKLQQEVAELNFFSFFLINVSNGFASCCVVD